MEVQFSPPPSADREGAKTDDGSRGVQLIQSNQMRPITAWLIQSNQIFRDMPPHHQQGKVLSLAWLGG
jgi:hypothetical protein